MKAKTLSLIAAMFVSLISFGQIAGAEINDNNNSATKAENIAKRLEKELNLNQKQVEKVKAIHLSEMEKTEALRKMRRDEMVAQREELAKERQALKEDKDALDSKRAELQAKRDSYEQKMSEIESNTKNQMKSVLSDAQYENYLMLLGKQQAKKEMKIKKKIQASEKMSTSVKE